MRAGHVKTLSGSEGTSFLVVDAVEGFGFGLAVVLAVGFGVGFLLFAFWSASAAEPRNNKSNIPARILLRINDPPSVKLRTLHLEV
jgi:hypothetical protein